MIGGIENQMTVAAGSAASALAGSADGLGSDVFLRLLVTQLRYQNPLRPIEDASFLSDLAQFRALEAMESVARAMDAVGTATRRLQAFALLGRQVLLAGGSADRVASVLLGSDGPRLRLESGAEVSLDDIASVTEEEETP